MELNLIEIFAKIANTSIKSHNKPELYDSATKMVSSFQDNEVPADFFLTCQAVQNIQSDLTARDEAVKVSASHLFLTLVQLSRTLAPDVAHDPNSWTLPIQTFVSNIKLLIQICFPLLGSTNNTSQQKSLGVVVQHIEAIKAWSDQLNEEAYTLLTNLIEQRILPRLEDMLGEPEKEELLAMKIWQQLIHSIGNYIPKTNHELINRLLKLVEFCFKNTRQEVQLCAYTSWSILIKTFSLHPTYLVKKLRLFNVPLLSCAVKQDHRYAPVDVERAKTWSQLMVSLTPDLQDHASTVCTPFFFFCIGLDPKITALKKFNETFKAHFTTFIEANINLVERSWNASFLDSNINFLNLLSCPNNTLHLPKKALWDAQALYDWRTQLCLQGIQFLAALIEIELEEPSSQLAHRYPVFNEISADLCQFSNNNKYLTARNEWVRENHKLILSLIGLSVHLFDPLDGSIVAECFRRFLHIMTSSYHMDDQLIYSILAICQTALAKRHSVPVIVSLVASIYHSFYGQIYVPIHESSDCTVAHLLIEILLDHHVLSFGETLPESFYDSYQNLLSCRNLQTIGLSDFEHFLTKLHASNNDPTSLWRGWKLTAEGILMAVESCTYSIASNSPDFSACCYALSFVFTRLKGAPDLTSIIGECTDVWKKLFDKILELIPVAEINQLIDSLCQHIISVTEAQLFDPQYSHFLTLLLDVLVSRLNLSYSLVYSTTGVVSSPETQSLDISEKLGNITFCISALSALLTLAHASLLTANTNDNTDVHMDSIEQLTDPTPVINSLLTTTINLFSHLTNPLLIQNVCACLSHPIGLYFQLASSSLSASTGPLITGLTARLWEVIETAILDNFKPPYNLEFLLILCPILLPIFQSSDTSILSGVCHFFSKTFVSCAEDVDFPDSLKTALASLQVKEMMQLHDHSSSPHPPETPVRTQIIHKLEERDNPVCTPDNKKMKLSAHDLSPLPDTDLNLHSDIVSVSLTSNHSTVDTGSCLVDPVVLSPREEDFLAHSNSSTTADTPSRLPIGETHDISNLCRFSKSPSNFYSDQKTRVKQPKYLKISDADKSKSKSNWQQSPNDKEKKAFFKLELTPIKLEELPKSSPTHQTVNRKLRFPGDAKNLEEIYDQETVSLPHESPDIEIISLDADPVPDPTAEPAADQQPVYSLNNLNKVEADSVDEFIKNIPLSDIISPDEMQAMQFEEAKYPDEAVDSAGTGSLMSITSLSVSQSVTPPFSDLEISSHTQTEAESILAFNECIMASDESPFDSEQPLIEGSEPMEIQNQNIVDLTSSQPKDSSPGTPTGPSTPNQSNTLKQSILKKRSVSTPSPSCKKVSFANPIEETHAIGISSRAKKLHARKQNLSSKVISAATSLATRRCARLGISGDLTRQENHPLFFPLTRSDGIEVDEDTAERDKGAAAPVDRTELPEVGIINPDCMSVSIQECSLEGVDTVPEFKSTDTQTDHVTSVDSVQGIRDTLHREMGEMSQQELTQVLTALSQLIPSIAQQITNSTFPQ